jgi:hypothetical protein
MGFLKLGEGWSPSGVWEAMENPLQEPEAPNPASDFPTGFQRPVKSSQGNSHKKYSYRVGLSQTQGEQLNRTALTLNNDSMVSSYLLRG